MLYIIANCDIIYGMERKLARHMRLTAIPRNIYWQSRLCWLL